MPIKTYDPRKLVVRKNRKAEIPTSAKDAQVVGAQKITLPLPPLGNRYIRRGRTHQYKTKEAKDYCDHVAYLGRVAGIKKIEGNVRIQVDVYRARRAGDLDGFGKVLLDSLEGVCYTNDNQIIDNHSRRFDDKENPRVEVIVEAA